MNGFAIGQTTNSVEGAVFDKQNKQPVADALITILMDGRLVASTNTNAQGKFKVLVNNDDVEDVEIICRHIGYESAKLTVDSNSIKKRIDFFLIQRINPLDDVEVKSKWKVNEVGDTIKYNPEAFKTANTKTVADLFANIPGFKVMEDGRLMFQNKTIHALLLDGDNVADEQYGIINKNLDVRAVAGVEVFGNYEKNAVLAAASESGKLAVNLKITEAFKGKIAGNISAGVAAPIRGLVQTSLIQIKQKSKQIFTGNVNNVALDQKGDAFKIAGTEYQAGSRSLESNPTQLLNTHQMSTPPLPASFTQNNRTSFGSLLGFKKLQNKREFTYRLAVERDNKRYWQQRETQYTVNNNQLWNLRDSSTFEHTRTQWAGTLNYRHNRSTKFAGEIFGNVLVYRPEFLDQRYLSGAVTDTTFSSHQRKQYLLMAGYDGAIKISKLGVFQIRASYERSQHRIADSLYTNRFNQLLNQQGAIGLGIDQNFQTNNQQFYFLVKSLKKYKKGNINYGVEGNWEQRKFLQQVNLFPSFGSTKISRFANEPVVIGNTWYGYAQIKYLPNKQVSWHNDLLAGSEGLQLNQQKFLIPRFKFQSFYQWRFLPRFSWEIRALAEQRMPDRGWFGPDTTLYGSQGLAVGLQEIQPVREFSAQTSISYNKLTGNTFRLHYQFTRNSNMPGWMPIITPEVVLLKAGFMRFNQSQDLSLHFNRYLYGLKGTVYINTSYTQSNSDLNVNELPVVNSFSNWMNELTWKTAFAGKINFEATGKLSKMNIIQRSNEFELESGITEMQWNHKTIFQPSAKTHWGYQHTALFYRNASCFAGQVYYERKINDKVNLHVFWHNTYGANALTYLFNSPNSSGRSSFFLVPSYLLAKLTWLL